MSYGGELSGKPRYHLTRAATMTQDSSARTQDSGPNATRHDPVPTTTVVFNKSSATSRHVSAERLDSAAVRKSLDVNRYATKKTIAQGMLDVALLTANASQLRYVLQVGEQHQFYSLMVSLIGLSIALQVSIGLLSFSLNLLRDCRLEQEQFARSAVAINYSSLGVVFLITTINVIISAFDILAGILLLILGALDISESSPSQLAANIINDITVVIIFIITFINVLIASFGIENTNRLAIDAVENLPQSAFFSQKEFREEVSIK